MLVPPERMRCLSRLELRRQELPVGIAATKLVNADVGLLCMLLRTNS